MGVTNFFNYVFLDNTILTYALFSFSLILSILFIKGISYIFAKRIRLLAEKSGKTIDQLPLNTIKQNVLPIMYFAAFYLNTNFLNINPTFDRWISIIVTVFIITIGAKLVTSIVIFYNEKHMKKFSGTTHTVQLVKWINVIIRILVWSIALVLFLDNMGIRITSLVAGLGVGGIAIAFAAQAILVDIFCYFSIFFDKPFEIGDFIASGDQMGTVEYIGVKTTRLRSLRGEQIILANSDLIKSRINNFKTMEERRVLFTLRVTYDTQNSKLKEIPVFIKEIVESVADVRFGRAHFSLYGQFGLEFEIVYFVLDKDFDKYMDVNQEINYRIKEEFEKREIEFAYPTQTLYLHEN